MFLKPDVDVYITGSNAYILSGELATLLSGRYIIVDMLPLSFKEYWEAARAGGKSVRENFNDYLRFGSFPYAAMLERSDAVVTPYIDGIYNTILVKDVAKREGITDIPLLESIVKFIASSIRSPMADRYDVKGRQYLKTLGKYYLVDTGIRNLLLSGSASDVGHLIENVVYLELLRRGFKVNIGKLAEKEIDFVASNMSGLTYYQVSASVLDAGTLSRELEPLQRTPDHYPKILLTLDEIGAGANYEGIRQMNLLDWLLGA